MTIDPTSVCLGVLMGWSLRGLVYRWLKLRRGRSHQ